MTDIKPVTVQDLLPALVELASIQHDLLSGGVSLTEPTQQDLLYGRPRELTVKERYKLYLRSRELLTWLVEKAKAAA